MGYTIECPLLRAIIPPTLSPGLLPPMKCPHCNIEFHDRWTENVFAGSWSYHYTHCPACNKITIQLTEPHGATFTAYPRGAVDRPVAQEVPAAISQDYLEAAEVLPISPKASAALARRCLQNVLRQNGIKERDLSKEIDTFLDRPDVPSDLKGTVDAIRNFGNFSAHPINDITGLQIIDVEEHEAEWCLDILDGLFDHFYVRPAKAAARKAALNAKLAAAGKPPAK